ncbi:hypothetical protein D3C76_807440 [compost metagenome]
MHLLRGQHFIGRDFPGVEDLAFQRHDRLEFAVTRLLGRAARRVTFNEEQLGAIKILCGAVGQFTRQRRTAGQLFTYHFLRRAHTALGAGNRHFSQHFCGLNVLVQPQAEGVFHHAGDEGRALTRRETLFGLPGKLRVLHFDRQHIRTAIPDIFRRQLHAARQNVTVFAELTHRIKQTLTQTVDVRTALHGWDQVDVAFCQQLAAFRQPQQRPVDRFRIAREVTEERFFRQRWQAVNRLSQIVVQTILIAPALFAAVDFVFEGNFNARAQHRFRFQNMR